MRRRRAPSSHVSNETYSEPNGREDPRRSMSTHTHTQLSRYCQPANAGSPRQSNVSSFLIIAIPGANAWRRPAAAAVCAQFCPVSQVPPTPSRSSRGVYLGFLAHRGGRSTEVSRRPPPHLRRCRVVDLTEICLCGVLKEKRYTLD